MRHLLVLPAVGALIASSVAAASAATIQVPPGTGTLQAAIDAAAPGDTLVEKSGLGVGIGITATSVTIDAGSANNLFRYNSVGTVSDAGIDTCWKGNQGYADACP